MTFPVTSSALAVTVHESPTLSKVTVAVASSRCGGVPAFASPAERAMQKQLACDAASSSSGLVFPSGASVRAAHDTARSLNLWLESALTDPEPLSRSPFQIAFA